MKVLHAAAAPSPSPRIRSRLAGFVRRLSWLAGTGAAVAVAAPPATVPAAAPATSAGSVTSTGSAAPAAAGPGLAPLRPYTAFAWAPAPPMRHLCPFFWVNPAAPGPAAREMARLPEGRRVMFLNSVVNDLLSNPEDRCRTPDDWPTDQPGVWAEKGVAAVSARAEAFFSAFAKAGGKCDLLVLDFEEGNTNWVMTAPRLKAIERDPRFPALTKVLGFSDVLETLDWSRTAVSGHYLKWNAVTGEMINDAVDRSIGGPLWRYFPAAGMSNFNSLVMDEKNVVPDLNGSPQYTLGKPVGTYQSPCLYGSVGVIGEQIHADWKKPMTDAIYTTNTVRAAARCSPMPVLPWVAFRSYSGDGPGKPVVPLANTDYWQESVYHAQLSGASTNLLFWDAVAPHAPGVLPPNSTTPRDVETMESVMADLERQAGGSPLAKPLTTQPLDYNARTIVSAARTASGKVVARVTFAEGVDSGKVEVEGKTYDVTRPQGKVGAWLEVP